MNNMDDVVRTDKESKVECKEKKGKEKQRIKILLLIRKPTEETVSIT